MLEWRSGYSWHSSPWPLKDTQVRGWFWAVEGNSSVHRTGPNYITTRLLRVSKCSCLRVPPPDTGNQADVGRFARQQAHRFPNTDNISPSAC